MLKRIKIICLMSLLITIIMPLEIKAQDNKKIDIVLNNVDLKDFLTAIEKQTEYTFMYKDLDLSQKVTINAKQQTMKDILIQVLGEKGITFQFSDKRIILQEGSNKKGQDNIFTINGSVVDEFGDPLLGVTVAVKGRATGTITDTDGLFTLQIPTDATLVFSFIGFQTKEVKVAGKTVFDIILEEDAKLLNEIIVVGYGTQKRVNLTGSVVAIDSKVLKSRPISNVSSGLQGLLPGVTIIGAGNRPGDNSMSIRVRGIGTIGNANPLILIDGIEGNINTLNPEDIESVSVLKDAASSAIYGSRAANGVILVTTKRVNKDKSTIINYNGNFALQMPAKKPQMLDAVEYLEMLREAKWNMNKPWGYTDADVDAVRNGTDPNFLANTNWVDEVFRSNAPQQTHNVSIAGGSESMGYYASYGHLSTDGLVVSNAYKAKRNNARVKLDTEVLDRLNLELNFGYTDVDNWTPMSSDTETSGLFYQALRSSPLVPVRFDDGKWGYGGSSGNPVALAHDGGFINYNSDETTLNTTATLKIIEGLTAKGQYGLRKKNVLRKNQVNKIDHFYPGTDKFLASSSNTSKISQRDVAEIYQSINAQADYDKTIGKHSFHVLAGFAQEWLTYEQMDASRENLISNDLHVINTAMDNMQNSGSAYHWALRSGFGRVNYNFDDRYLFEFNIRYDLSSRFHHEHRGSYFPSASAAWRISEEAFMKETRSFLDNLKVRLSYGTLGNQYVGDNNYPYMSVIETGTGMPIGGTSNITMEQIMAANRRLTWESINMTNIGIDFTVLNHRLSITADYFIKDTKDILLKVSLPGVIGVDRPYQNAGKVRNKGWEINLAWNDKIGSNFSYGMNANLSDAKNKVTSMGDVADNFSGNQITAVGYPIGAFWGYKADGLADFDDFTYDPINDKYNANIPILEAYREKYGPGDIKLKDLDNNGEITKEGDRTYLGSSIPRYTYSFGGNAKWKDFDFQFFFQGVGKADGLIDGLGRHAFTELANYPQKEHRNRWTFENPNPNAKYPRFTYDEKHNQSNLSSFWIEDASYLRLKNVQVGYTLPKGLLSKLKVDNCRFYFSGENLLTFTDFFGAYDPETPISGGGFYPVVKTVSMGISITLK